jgi:hypothetical protein
MFLKQVGLLLTLLGSCMAGDGTVKTTGIGQICTKYSNALSYTDVYSDDYKYFCYGYTCKYFDICCPFSHGANCYVYAQSAYVNNIRCSAGCVDVADCTPVANATFTTAGSCEFACNTSMVKNAAGTGCVESTASAPNVPTTTPAPPMTADGYPKTAGIGQYCSVYYAGKSEIDNYKFQFSNRGSCGCRNGFGSACGTLNPWCPTWYYGYGCRSEYHNTDYDGEQHGSNFCDPGCVEISWCTPIPNATFTGPGTATSTGTPDTCPFTCDSGLLASNRTCAADCAPGSYKNGSVCSPCGPGTYTSTSNTLTACTACAPNFYANATGSTSCAACEPCTVFGYYRSGCNATSGGACTICTVGS